MSTMSEGFPAATATIEVPADIPNPTEIAPKPVSLFYEDGTLNEAALEERFGLSAEEANQPIKFMSYSGTVAQMLNDEACPVGAAVSESYQKNGLEGTTDTINGFMKLANPDYDFKVSEATREREAEKTLKKKNQIYHHLSYLMRSVIQKKK